MNKKIIYLVLLVSILFVTFAIAGCIEDEPLPPGYGKLTVCSSSSSIYGKVYIDGNRIGSYYLNPKNCLYQFANVKLYEEHVIRIETDWGISYTENFYSTYSGYTVTVY